MDLSTLSELGDDDIALIVRLLQEDGQQAISVAIGKGKHPENTKTDTQIAFELFLEEVKNAETYSSDRRMTRSIQHAVQTDAHTIIQSQNDELIARNDHIMSLALSNGQNRPPVPRSALASISDNEFFIEKLSQLYITGADHKDGDRDICDDEDLVTPESSIWAAVRQTSTRQKRECAACGEAKTLVDLAKASCVHEYCRECLTHLFRDAMTDETLFPPRCCRLPIAFDEVRFLLEQDVVQQFHKKALEFSTPNRTYCHNPNCSAFIPPANYVDSVATCEECGDRTCTTCKRASHNGDCPNDEQLQRVIQLGREQGWQRCENCRGMVELDTGCNHMTCRCGFEFCYVCGARWKSCQCDQWEEDRLYARAAQIDARDHVGARGEVEQHHANGANPRQVAIGMEAARRGPEQQLREQRVQERNRQLRLRNLVRDLRNDHECDHELWFNRGGPRACEECHDVMPLFIYECRQCHIMACRRCRYHRL